MYIYIIFIRYNVYILCIYIYIEQLESDSLRKKLKNISPYTQLSEQQLLSCDKATNDSGCNGGWFDDAYRYIDKNNGLVYNNIFPYTNEKGGNATICNYNQNNSIITVKTFTNTNSYEIGFQSEDELADYVLHHGPVATVVDATKWHLYEYGILSSCKHTSRSTSTSSISSTSSSSLSTIYSWFGLQDQIQQVEEDEHGFKYNHAVQIVGINIPNKYWIVSFLFFLIILFFL
jgi:hypothetical protein